MKLIDSIVKYSDTLFPVNCDGGTNEITKANTDKHVLNLHVLILK